MPITIETFQEFRERHKYQTSVREGANVMLYSDGAMSDDESGMIRKEPPTHPIELLKAKRRYLAARIKQQEEAFVNLKTGFAEQLAWSKRSSQCMPPPTNAVALLKKQGAYVRKLRAELADVDQQLNETDEAKQRRLAAEIRKADDARLAALQREIDAVTI